MRRSTLSLLIAISTMLPCYTIKCSQWRWTSNATLVTAGLWGGSQVSRYVTYLVRKFLMRAVISEHLSSSTFTQEQADISQLQNLARDAADLHPQVKILTEDRIEQAYSDVQNDSQERIWVVYDSSTSPACMEHNIIMVDEKFMTLPYNQQLAILRHEIQHAKANHMPHFFRLMGLALPCTAALLISLPTTLSYTEAPHNTPYFEIYGKVTSFPFLSIATMLFTKLIGGQWEEIEADLAAKDHYDDLYAGIRSLRDKYKQESKTPENTRWQYCKNFLKKLADPHQRDSLRYLYAQHYATYHRLPWYIMMRPAYWLGRPLLAANKLLQLFDTPTDYILHIGQSTYTCLRNAFLRSINDDDTRENSREISHAKYDEEPIEAADAA